MKNKISDKLIYYIIFVSLIITSISIYFQIENTYENEITSFKKELNSVKKERLPILREFLWNVNKTSTDIFLNNLLHNDKFIYVKITESDGSTIQKGINKTDNVMKREFHIEKLIDNKKYNMGKLLIVADLDPLYGKIKNQTITIIVTEIIKIFFIILIIILIAKRFLTNKLEIMALYAKNLSIDTLDNPLNIHHIDKDKDDYNELDIVEDAINTMRNNLLDEIKKSKEKDNMLSHQSKMASMGEMIGNIAHQWRQPLSVISTSSSSVKLHHEMNMLKDDYLISSVDNILSSTKYLSDTIDDFRNFFKPNKEKIIFNLEETFERSFKLFTNHLDSRNIKLIKNIENIDIKGFDNELIQVIINIINNAKDELIKKDENFAKYILIDTSVEDEILYIKIKDNAEGIPTDIISKIFEPYFTTKGKSQGTGIGLYMSQEIITRHFEGDLSVENVFYTYDGIQYNGAQFTISFNIN